MDRVVPLLQPAVAASRAWAYCRQESQLHEGIQHLGFQSIAAVASSSLIMDSLLATYGSDDEDVHDQEESLTLSPPPSLAIAKPSSLFGRLPPPKTFASSGTSLFGSLPAPQLGVAVKLEDGIEEQSKPRSGLFAKLPAPKFERFGTGSGDGNPTSSLFAALPPSKGEFDSSRVKVEVGFGNPEVKKEKVVFKPPIDMSLSEDDDDDWRPAQKKAKGESAATSKGGGGLQALLPAPKHGVGLGSALGGGGSRGGRRAVMEVAARTRSHDVKAEPADVNSGISTASATPAAVAKGAYASQAAVQYENSVYAVDESAAFAPQVPYSNDAYGWTAPQGTYPPAQEIPQSMHNVNSQYEQHNWQYTANVSSYASQSSQASYAPANFTPVNDPVAQVLQAERRRGRRDKMAAPTVIEIKQAELTGGKVREDQLRSTGIAFGPSYQPVSSSKDKPSKLQRRKHQIGTLLHDMKAREMELLDRRAKGSLTKAETQAKYGW